MGLFCPRVEFPQTFLRATITVSLLTVWVLVGLFAYLNRYTKREYFTIWTVAWLFYALWLTLNHHGESPEIGSLPSMIQQTTVAISAAFLLWGTLRFLDLPVPQRLFGLFIVFLVAWTFYIPKLTANPLQIQLPVFILMGAGSVFAGVCFYRLRLRLPFVGAGMLSFGFFLWGLFLATYPIAIEYRELRAVGYLIAAVLQLFIAVSMIVLVLEEVRYKTEKVLAEIAQVRSEKQALETKILSAEEEIRRVYDQVRLTEGAQHAYEELRRTQQTVVQQERLRALGEMASGMAHDINNALSPVSAYAELLHRALATAQEPIPTYLKNISTAAGDIGVIVGRMREFYRPRSSREQLHSVDLNRLVAEVIDLTRPRWRNAALRQGLAIEVVPELAPDLQPFAGDPAELREALINLVFNAVDALPRGGRIVLATAALPPESPSKKPRVRLEVRDDGIGMDEATRQRCLEPFFTTKAQRGTGLGLSMIYGMMRRHEGSIDIESMPGRGTTVRLTFPRNPAPEAPRPAPKRPPASRGAFRILCVDDEHKIRRLVTDCLETLGHRVTAVANGKEALRMLEKFAREGVPFQVMITDLGMPDMDGHQLSREVKRRSPGLPVIMMTGWGTMMKDEGAQPGAIDGLLGKPPKLEDLDALVTRLASR